MEQEIHPLLISEHSIQTVLNCVLKIFNFELQTVNFQFAEFKIIHTNLFIKIYLLELIPLNHAHPIK
jgi:hypothetical protein